MVTLLENWLSFSYRVRRGEIAGALEFFVCETGRLYLLNPTANAKNRRTETADAKTARTTLTPTKRRHVDTPFTRPTVPVTAVPSSRLMKPTANASVKFFWGHR